MKKINLQADPVLKQNLMEKLQLPASIAELLINRGFTSEHEILDYLLVEEEKMADPMLLPDMEKACARITAAIKNQEQITICGDYDVDGTLATTILLRFLKTAGAKVNHFIPHRTKDGYGISDVTMTNLHEQGTKIAISVDTGTTAFDAAHKALAVGIDLIVTDHHNLSPEGLPPVYALINAKRMENDDNFTMLAGAGIAYYFVRALNMYWTKNKIREALKENDYLVMAMMASIADVVPLQKDNRLIVKYGLVHLPMTRVEGLRALFQELKLQNPSARDIAFRFAPIINAAGRLGSAEQALDLFLEKNQLQATLKAQDLIALNRKRQKMSQELNEEVLKIGAEIVKTRNPPCIVVHGKFHVGIIGIAAAKLVDAFHRPAIVIGFDDTGYGKASCRSVAGFNIKSGIDYAKDFHEGGGGHDMAAGFSITTAQVDKFTAKVEEYFLQQSAAEAPPLKIEATIDFADINRLLIKYVEMFEPFGKGNSEIIVQINNLKVSEQREVRGGHLYFTFEKEEEFNGILFNPKAAIVNNPPQNFSAIGKLSAARGAMRLEIIEII